MSTPIRLRAVRGISARHRMTLRSMVAATSIDAMRVRLHISPETIQTAMTEGGRFRNATADRIEKAIDAASAERAA